MSVYLCNGKPVLQEGNVYEFRLSMTSNLDVIGKICENEKKSMIGRCKKDPHQIESQENLQTENSPKAYLSL